MGLKDTELREALKMSDEYYGTTTYPCVSCGVAHPDIDPNYPYCVVCSEEDVLM